MRTPPLLLGATLVFWGWQTGFLLPGLVMALILEGARLIRFRWELSDEEFGRIWTFCSVLLLAATIFAFAANSGPSQLGRLLQSPTPANQNGAGIASARTATALFRWLPMIFFLFVAAQAYSVREEIPLTILTRILRWRWNSPRMGEQPAPAVAGMNVGFPYFGICLFAASSHPGESTAFFWGCSALVAWALWTFRSRRYGFVAWAGVLGAAIALGYGSQHYVGRLQGLISNLDPQLFSRFAHGRTDVTEVQTAIGQVGRMKLSGRIVIRLRPEVGSAPQYLREASYRTFRSPAWSSGETQEELTSLYAESNATTWVLLPDKTSASKIQIACYLNGVAQDTGQPRGVLPLPPGADRLEDLPAYPVKKTPTGAIVAEGLHLAMFKAAFGPGATIDAPADFSPDSLDLSVPRQEKPALDQVTSALAVQNASDADKLRAVSAYFQNNFSYGFWKGRPRDLATNETALSRFLLRTRLGHCEYFATATVLLLRELGIPARYAVGYAVHEASGKGYVVRERDAHAWCLVWDNPTRTWLDFDTTPGSWVAAESDRASSFERLMDVWSWIGFQFSRLREGQSHLRQYALIALVLVLALMLYRIVFRRNRRFRRRSEQGGEPATAWPGKDSEFYFVERALIRRGMPRRPEELLSGWLERAVRDQGLASVRTRLRRLLDLHYRFRFDPAGLDSEERLRLRQEAQAVQAELERP